MWMKLCCCCSFNKSVTPCQDILKVTSIKLVISSNLLIFYSLLLLLSSIFLSIRVFSNESALHIRWPKYWSFSFSISPSSEYSGLISFRIDWFDLLAVQETLKHLLQQHNSKTSVLQHSAFFMLHLSHPYKTMASNPCFSVIFLLCYSYQIFQIPYACYFFVHCIFSIWNSATFIIT